MTTQEATVLDGRDPLQGFRDRFLIPRHDGDEQAYFCGNSLGLSEGEQARLYHGTALEWLGLPRSRFE